MSTIAIPGRTMPFGSGLAVGSVPRGNLLLDTDTATLADPTASVLSWLSI